MNQSKSESLKEYAKAHSRPVSQVLEDLEEETWKSAQMAGMLSGQIPAKFYQILCQTIRAKYTLDIGTFTGYSALAVAEALPEDGKVITCDINPDSTAIAKKFWNKSPHGHKIELKMAPALETIAAIQETLDFVFIDADKGNYINYWEAVIPKVRSGGLIAVDNVFMGGGVLNPETENAQAIVAFNEHIMKDARVDHVMLSVRDGITLAVKK